MKDKIADKLVSYTAYIITGLFAIICVIPLWMALCASFSNETALVRDGYSLWFNQFDLTSYKIVLSKTGTIYRAYAVTIGMTVIGTCLTVFFTALTAYPLSVRKLRYGSRINFFIYLTMLLNGGLVPNYILITRVLGMKNSFWVLIIP